MSILPAPDLKFIPLSNLVLGANCGQVVCRLVCEFFDTLREATLFAGVYGFPDICIDLATVVALCFVNDIPASELLGFVLLSPLQGGGILGLTMLV